MTFDEVQDQLVQWLVSTTGFTTIAARQGIARPELPYLMVEKQTSEELTQRPNDVEYVTLTSQNSEGFDEVQATPKIEIEWTFFVYSYGESGDIPLQRVKMAAHLSQIQEPLSPVLNIHETGVLNNIPEFVDQQWEPRFQINIMIRGVSSDDFVIDTIESHTPFDIQVE